jgi:hypothetical protein
VQALGIGNVPSIGIESVKSAGSRVVVSCAEVLQARRVGLLAGVEEIGRGGCRIEAEGVAVGVVVEELTGAGDGGNGAGGI